MQATLGPIALDLAMRRELEEFIPISRQVLTVAVLSILITAPIGAVGIAVGGRKLLTRELPKDEKVDVTVTKDLKTDEETVTTEQKMEQIVAENHNHETIGTV